MVRLDWKAPAPDHAGVKPIRCIGCRRTFLGVAAFYAHETPGGACGSHEHLKSVGLQVTRNGPGGIWFLLDDCGSAKAI